MTRHIVDTNILLTFVTDRDPPRREIVSRVFQGAASLREELWVISNVVTEFVHVLTTVYGVEAATVRSMVVDLLDTPGVLYHHGYYPGLVFRIWPAEVRDFGDAVVAAAASTLDLPVYTADNAFGAELSRIGVAAELLR